MNIRIVTLKMTLEIDFRIASFIRNQKNFNDLVIINPLFPMVKVGENNITILKYTTFKSWRVHSEKMQKCIYISSIVNTYRGNKIFLKVTEWNTKALCLCHKWEPWKGILSLCRYPRKECNDCAISWRIKVSNLTVMCKLINCESCLYK